MFQVKEIFIAKLDKKYIISSQSKREGKIIYLRYSFVSQEEYFILTQMDLSPSASIVIASSTKQRTRDYRIITR